MQICPCECTYSNEYLDKGASLYPDVHDFLHNPLHYFKF